MDDLIDGEWCSGRIRILLIMVIKFLGDAFQPFFEYRLGPCIQGGKRANDASFTLCDHQIGVGNDKER